MITLAIIDDHAVVRKGLAYMLGLEPDFKVIGDATGDANSAEWVKNLHPDVLLLDIYMPGKSGLEILADLQVIAPQQKVLMLTTSGADNDAYEALALGARGYLLKDRDTDEVCRAIQFVAAGATYVPDQVRELVRQRQMTPTPTPRELEVLSLAAKGLSNEKIGEKLGLSVNTVKVYMRSLLIKFDASDRAGAVVQAIKRGFIR